MSLSTAARTARNIELRGKENEIAALYQQQKSDEEIAEALHIEAFSVRATREGMGLPPLRSASGRLFTPDVDVQILELRDEKGWTFRAIGESLGHLTMDVEVRHRILKRLEGKSRPNPYKAVIPCKLCAKPFISDDRRRIRFCQPCRTDELPGLDCSPYDPDFAGGCYSAHVSIDAV